MPGPPLWALVSQPPPSPASCVSCATAEMLLREARWTLRAPRACFRLKSRTGCCGCSFSKLSTLSGTTSATRFPHLRAWSHREAVGAIEDARGVQTSARTSHASRPCKEQSSLATALRNFTGLQQIPPTHHNIIICKTV